MSNDIDIRRRRALYRAEHRGTKEMDLVLGAFAKARLEKMPETALGQFEELLLQPDPELQDMVLGARAATPEFADLIADIRSFHGLTGA